MRHWWSGAALAMPRGAFGGALLVACGTVVACSGSSKSNGGPSSSAGRGGSSAGSGASGSGASGSGASGSGASGSGAGGTGGGVAGDGSSSGGVGDGGVTGEAGRGTGGTESGGAGLGGESNAGSSGAAPAGAAGDAGSHAGEAAGGAGGGCDWCSVDAPACCGEELRCVEGAPSCRIEVLAQSVDVIYQYAELQAAVDALSGAIGATIPLSEVELAAVDPAPAARWELTLNANASAEFSSLAGLHLNPFRVACEDQELFIGVTYMLEGAAAIRTPVLHAEVEESGALVLRLGAWQGAWIISGSPSEPGLRERIDRTELRAELCASGVLSELP